MVGAGGGSHDLGLETWARFQQLEGGKGVPGVGKVMSCVRVRGMAWGSRREKPSELCTQSHGIFIFPELLMSKPRLRDMCSLSVNSHQCQSLVHCVILGRQQPCEEGRTAFKSTLQMRKIEA